MTRDLDALTSRTFDLLIVGGGIAGCAAAWDAAQRGLDVALVEAGDFGSGTSWNSLKTIHGGLRYLPRLDLTGLRESVRERRALLRIAPSVVRPLSFAVPVRGHGARGPIACAAAAFLYGALSGDRNDGVPPERHLQPPRVLRGPELARRAPGLGSEAALVWDDAQVERAEALLLAFVRAAAGQGAVVANYAPATTLLRDGARVVGAEVRDALSGRVRTVRARVVLAALGEGLDALLERSSVAPTRLPWQSAVNVVLRGASPSDMAYGGESSGRHLFLVPWRGRTMIGTDYGPRGAADGDRVARLLEDAARAFPFLADRVGDVALVHHGFVPGESAHALRTRDLFVDHAAAGAPGLLSATAAKYTTARALAERSVDHVLQALARAPIACRTASTPLPLASADGLDLEGLTRRAVREEWALHLSDVVRRRTDVGTAECPDAGTLERMATAMGEELGWSAEARLAETRETQASYPGSPGGGMA